MEALTVHLLEISEYLLQFLKRRDDITVFPFGTSLSSVLRAAGRERHRVTVLLVSLGERDHTIDVLQRERKRKASFGAGFRTVVLMATVVRNVPVSRPEVVLNGGDGEPLASDGTIVIEFPPGDNPVKQVLYGRKVSVRRFIDTGGDTRQADGSGSIDLRIIIVRSGVGQLDNVVEEGERFRRDGLVYETSEDVQHRLDAVTEVQRDIGAGSVPVTDMCERTCDGIAHVEHITRVNGRSRDHRCFVERGGGPRGHLNVGLYACLVSL